MTRTGHAREFVLHVVADIHQALSAGGGADRGWN